VRGASAPDNAAPDNAALHHVASCEGERRIAA
jgi:hypothetical protein